MKIQTKIGLFIGLAATTTTSLLLAPPVQASKSSESAAISALYRRQDRAMERKNVAALGNIYAPDFAGYLKTPDGYKTVTAPEIFGSTQLLFQPMGHVGIYITVPKCQTRIKSIRWRGPDAIVEAVTTAVVVTRYKSQRNEVETVSATRDYWSKFRSGWKVRQSVERTTRRWLNGRRYYGEFQLI